MLGIKNGRQLQLGNTLRETRYGLRFAQCCESKRFAYTYRVVKKNPHAVEMGRQDGKARTPQKIEAARRNGRKGGRPPTRQHPHISDSGASLPEDIRTSSEDAPGWLLTDKQVGIEE